MAQSKPRLSWGESQMKQSSFSQMPLLNHSKTRPNQRQSVIRSSNGHNGSNNGQNMFCHFGRNSYSSNGGGGEYYNAMVFRGFYSISIMFEVIDKQGLLFGCWDVAGSTFADEAFIIYWEKRYKFSIVLENLGTLLWISLASSGVPTIDVVD